MRKVPKRLVARSDLLLAALAAAVAVLALAVTVVYRITVSEELRKQTATNCRDIETIKAAISGVLLDSKVEAMSRNSDPAIRRAIERYYARQLARFAPQDCPNLTGGAP